MWAQTRNGSLFILMSMNWEKKSVALCLFGTVLLVAIQCRNLVGVERRRHGMYGVFIQTSRKRLYNYLACAICHLQIKNTWSGMFVSCTTEQHHTIALTNAEGRLIDSCPPTSNVLEQHTKGLNTKVIYGLIVLMLHILTRM